MIMAAKRKEKSFWEMSDTERDKYVKRLDRPIPPSKTRPLTKPEREQFERMRRSPYQSIHITRDRNDVLVRIEPDLLRRSQKYAADHKMTLSEVINRSLRALLAIVE